MTQKNMTMEKTAAASVDIEREQSVATSMSMWGALIIFFISAAVGMAVDSITLILDAAASLVILAGALMARYSLKRINLPPDEMYNFGYSKYEPLTGSMQAGLIIATCVVSIKFAIQDIIHDESVHTYVTPVIASFFSGVLALFIFLSIKRIAKRTKSGILKAASFHWGTDALLSFGLCLGFSSGLQLERMGYSKMAPYVDPVMAIILALFLVKTPFKFLIGDVRELLDTVPDKSVQAEVNKVVDTYKPKSFGVSRMRIRKSGPRIFLDICYIVKGEHTVTEINELADNFKKDLETHISNCDAVVYFHPLRS